MADEIQGLTVKVGVTDEAFTGGIAKINKAMSLLQSEFKASSEGLKGFGDTTQQIGAKSEYLNRAIELQQQKVKALQEAYAKSKQETGEFSNSTMSAGTKVNNAVAQLARMQNELKAVDTELAKTGQEEKKLSVTEGLNKLGSGVEGAKSKILSLKTAFATVTATLAGGFGLVKFTEGAIEAGDNAYKLSQKLHLTTAESASLNKIFSITGTDSSAFASTMVKLDKSLEGAGEKGNATTKVLEKYSVSLTDANGKLLPMNQQLEKLAEGYKKSAEAGEEDAFSAEVLGNKGASLIPLLENYTEAKEAAAKVKGIGIDPKEAHQTEEELKVLKMQVSATGGVVAKALIPIVQEILPPLITLFQNIATKVKENKAELDKFIQSLVSIGQQVAQTVQPVISSLFGFVSEHGEASKNIILGLVGAFVGFEGVSKTIDGVKNAMDTWSKAMEIKDKISGVITVIKNWEIATKLQAAATKILELAQGALNIVMNANPIALIVLAIGALVAGIVIAYNKCDWFREKVNAIGEWLKNFFTVTLPQAFNTVITFFQNNWKEILLFIVNPFAGAFALLYKNNDTFRQKVNELMAKVKEIFVNGWNAVKTFFTETIPQMVTNIVQWFTELPNKIMYGLGELVGMLATWGVQVWSYFSTNVPLWINNVTTFFSQLPGNIWNFLVDIITKLGEWGSNVLNYITANVPIWINNVVTFFSELPGKIWEFLVSVVTKLGEWGSNVISWISSNVSAWITNIVTFFSQLPGQIWTWLVNCVTNITTWGSNMYNEASTTVNNVITGIETWFSELPDKMLDIGKNIVAGLKNGIANEWDNLKGWIGGLCDSFTAGVKAKFDQHSPSKVFAEIGKFNVQGLGVGWENEMPDLNAKVSKTLDSNIKIANLSSLDSLKSLDKAYSNSGQTSTSNTTMDKILDKMDRLEKALDIKVNGKSIVEQTYEAMGDKFALVTDRGV